MLNAYVRSSDGVLAAFPGEEGVGWRMKLYSGILYLFLISLQVGLAQEVSFFRVSPGRQIGFHPLVVLKEEPLRLEQEAFFECVEERTRPRVAGEDGCLALEVALAILAKIEEHSRVVADSLAKVRKP